MPCLIDAHRGECGVPGLPVGERYRRAIALGVDYVEIDVRLTHDHVMVNYHDHVTPGGRIIGNLTHADLTEELGPQAQTLEEVLDIVTGSTVRLHVDVKEVGREGALVEALLKRLPADRFVLTGEDASIRLIRQRFPHIKAGLTLGWDATGANPLDTARVRLSELFPDRRVRACRADFIAANWQLARLTVLTYCAWRHLPAWVWTVDAEKQIARYVRDPRVAVLITNRPDLALRLRP
jgi:glycerophosphoryl diester phosphodiesterase